MKKTAITLAAALTVFVLLIVSGVGYAVLQNQNAAAAAPAADVATEVAPNVAPANDLTANADLAKQIAERDQAYQDVINQANQRLEQAQQEIKDLRAQVDSLQKTNASSSNQMVSIQQAAQIAANYLGQNEIYSAASIMQGNALAAYQVTFSSGDIVLVSPTGQILGVQPAANSGFQSSQQPGRSGHEENEGREFDHD